MIGVRLVTSYSGFVGASGSCSSKTNDYDLRRYLGSFGREPLIVALKVLDTDATSLLDVAFIFLSRAEIMIDIESYPTIPSSVHSLLPSGHAEDVVFDRH